MNVISCFLKKPDMLHFKLLQKAANSCYNQCFFLNAHLLIPYCSIATAFEHTSVLLENHTVKAFLLHILHFAPESLRLQIDKTYLLKPLTNHLRPDNCLFSEADIPKNTALKYAKNT